ncbi:MAG: hypothetical protein KJO30_12860 [Boseongicola sp.]|nr:hypothetical protein [Boseongicola sp.]NNJ68972.1 hypothetical protein [Boseongicola sp.]
MVRKLAAPLVFMAIAKGGTGRGVAGHKFATIRPHKRLLVCCVDEGCVVKFSFFRQKLSGSFKEDRCSKGDASDAISSRVFDPADLEMLKNRQPHEKKTATKSEFVTLFRSQLRPLHRQG